MVTAFKWSLFAYVALKIIGMALAREPGFRRARPSFRDRISAGEPALLITPFAVFMPLVLLLSWSSDHTNTETFDDAVACYGRIIALRRVPAISGKVREWAVYERVEGYKGRAYGAASALGMTAADAKAALDRQAASSAARYARHQAQAERKRMKDEVSLTLRCLNDSHRQA